MAFGDVKGTFGASQASITNPMPSVPATGSAVVDVGDLIIHAIVEQTGLTATTVSDNLGNVYAALNAGNDTGAVTLRTYYSRVTVAGTITSIDTVATASANDCITASATLTGPFEDAPLDKNPANGTADLTTPYTCPATGTLSQSAEVVVAFLARGTSTSIPSATSPNILVGTVTRVNIIRLAIGSQVVAATTSVSPEFTSAADPAECILGTASFRKALGKTVAADAGSYALTGTVAGTLHARLVSADAGAYALTGTDATLTYGTVGGYTIAADAGAYALTGTDAGLLHSRLIDASAGSYALSGTDAGLLLARKLAADAGSYGLTGTTASLLANRIITADAGSYALTGTAASLLAARIIAADAGSYGLTGADAGLLAARLLAAAAGSYGLTGADAGLLYSRLLTADAGAYSLTGTEAALLYSSPTAYSLSADPGSYVMFGSDVLLAYAAIILNGGPGSNGVYEAGQWNAVCDRCGRTHKARQLQLEWNGLRVCPSCWDPKHPQLSVQGKSDNQLPPWVSPEPPDVFIVTQIDWDDL